MTYQDTAALTIGHNAANDQFGTNPTGNTFTITNSSIGELTIGADIIGTGALAKSGTGSLTLTGANTYTGATTVNAGGLTLQNGAAISDSSAVTVAAGATVTVTNAETVGSLAGAGNVTLTQSLTAGGDNTSTTYSGTANGSGGLTKTGTGTLTLSGSNSYTGATTVNTGGLTLQNGSAVGDSSAVTVASGATLTVTSAETVGSLAGAGNVTLTQSLTAGGDDTSTTYSGTASSTGALTKTGTGTLTLSGSNSYTGATTVSAGGLALQGGSAIADSSAVTVASGATLTVTNAETVGSLTGAGNVTLTQSLTAGGDNTSTTYSGVASGAGGLTKGGSGTLTLSGSNTYTGATTVNAGGVTLQGGSAIGDSSAVTVASGTTLTVTNAETVGSLAGAGNVTLSQSLTAGGDNTNTTYSGTASSTGGLTKGGSGTLTLSGSNSYTGATLVSAGGLTLQNGSAIADSSAVSITSGATLTVSNAETVGSVGGAGDVALTQSLTTGGNNTNTTYSGVASGAGGLTKSGSGTMTLSGNNTYTGATTVNAGGLTLQNGSAIADTDAVTVASGATLTVTNAETVGSLAGAGNVTLTQTLTAGGNNTDTTYSGIASGAGGLTKAGTGTLTITGANTYSGGTTLNAGTLIVGDDGALGTGTLTITNGTLQAANGSRTVSNNLAVDGSFTVDNTEDTTMSGVVSGSGSLIKTNTNTTTLTSDSSSFSGTTTVDQGALVVNGTLGDGTATLTVNSGGTLQGHGTVSGPVTIASGGILSPGTSPGTLSVSGSVTQASGSLFDVEIDGTGTGNGSGNYDRVLVSGTPGTFTAGGTIVPTLCDIPGSATNTYTPPLGQMFEVVTASGGVDGSFSGLTQPSSGLPIGTRFDALYGSNSLTLIVTPEQYDNLAAVGASQSKNEREVGEALDQIRPAAGTRMTGDTAALFSALYLQSGDPNAINDSLDSLSGVIYSNTTTAMLRTQRNFGVVLDDRLRAVRHGTAENDASASMTRLALAYGSDTPQVAVTPTASGTQVAQGGGASAGRDGKIRAWASPFGSFGSVSNDNNAAGFDQTGGGVMIGGDMTILPGFDAGGTFGYGHTWVDGDDNSGDADVDSYLLGTYASYTLGQLFVSGSASYTFDEYDTSRNVNVGSLHSSGNADASGGDTAVSAKVGYRFEAEGYGIEPSAGVRYDHLTRDSLNENNAGAFGLHVDSETLNAVQTHLGVEANRNFDIDSVSLVPSVRVGWAHDAADYVGKTQASLYGSSFTADGADPGRDAATFGVGVTASGDSTLAVFADYDGKVRKDANAHVVRAGLRMSWEPTHRVPRCPRSRPQTCGPLSPAWGMP